MAKGFASLACLVIVLCLVHSACEATILHVPDEYGTIQEALNAAGPGDTVLVEHGTYQENIIWPSTPGIKLFANEASPPDSTYLEPASIPAPTITMAPPLAPSPIDSTTVIRGFVLRNGYAIDGGAIYIENASPTIGEPICWNRFESNMADTSGGAIYCRLSSARIQFNEFQTNSAIWGGTIAGVDSSELRIYSNTITGGVGIQGGGIYLPEVGYIAENEISDCNGDGAALYIGGNVVVGGNYIHDSIDRAIHCDGSVRLVSNVITDHGNGAIDASGSSATIEYNTFERNLAPDGPAILCLGGNPTIRFNTFRSNGCPLGQKQNYIPGVIHVEHGWAAIERNTFVDNTPICAAISVCDIRGSVVGNYISNNSTGFYT